MYPILFFLKFIYEAGLLIDCMIQMLYFAVCKVNVIYIEGRSFSQK